MTRRFLIPVLLSAAGFWVLPARSTADDKENEPPATRPEVSEEVAPLEAFAPVARDGHEGEAYLRKPPGKGPFPAVVLVHEGIVRWRTEWLKEYALGVWPSRFLAAGYVVAVPTYRSRDVDPQTRESPEDVLAAVESVRKLSYVDPKSIVVYGMSGGGDLALTVATETDVAVIVPEEPASMVLTGVFDKNTPKKARRFYPADSLALCADPKKFYAAEHKKLTREKLARIRCPIILVQGDLSPITNFNKEILIPELRDLGRNVVVLTYPGEPHGFAFTQSTERLDNTPYRRTATQPFPAVAEGVFEDVNALVRRHLPTKPSPIDPRLVKQVPFDAK